MCVEKYSGQPQINPSSLSSLGSSNTIVWDSGLRKDVEELKREMLEIKELLLKAKEYDNKNNEPDCDKEEKIKVLTDLARLVGVELSEIFTKN